MKTGFQDAHLADDVPVGEPDDHAVLRRVVLVLILDNQALTSKKVSLSLWTEETWVGYRMRAGMVLVWDCLGVGVYLSSS